MIKAVIFDMDGVIVDSEPIQSKSWEKLLHERGITPIFNENGFIHEIGSTGDKSYLKIMKSHNITEDLQTIRKRRREIFVKILQENLTPNPGLIKLLEEIKKKKLKIAVASNRLLEHVYLVLDELHIRTFFDAVIGPRSDLRHKPFPDIYIETAKELGLIPSECIAIEDSDIGIISAKAAGMKTIALTTPHISREKLSQADSIVDSLDNINPQTLENL